MADDLRERIARAIEAEADRAAGDLADPARGATRAGALHDAARIARGTPDAAAEREARVGELEARVGELEAAAREAEARDARERELP